MKTKVKQKKTSTDPSLEDILIPGVLPVLPLRDIIIFPYMIFPVLVGRESSIKAAQTASEGEKYIFLSAQKQPNIENPTKEDIFKDGTIAKIVQVMRLPNGLMKILVDGMFQGRILKYTNKSDFFEAHIEPVIPEIPKDQEITALIRQLTNQFKEYVKVNRNIPPEAITSLEAIDEPDRRLFYVAANIAESIEEKQKILQHSDLKAQLYEALRILNAEIDILKIEKDIDSKVQENIARSQRKYIIQEQIKILQDELGEDEETTPENAKLAEQLKKSGMPAQVMEKAKEELNKLNKIPSLSPEYTVIRNYLDWLLSVPWKKKTKDKLDITHVRSILDEDHFGLEKPKDRIIEYIAVLNLVKNMRGQILCFAGPPGVGKTSLGRSIARALGREFVRISLGGVRDEAEIRGHRRTYIGALPGKIVQAMKRAGTVNPVILLDEIDKLSSDFRGDPSSAMLEVLDPEQNSTFQDHYLEVDYDLSQVMFITTANVRYSIPLPLQDRMEIIELSSYLDHDKLEIAKRHILPKQLKAHGLEKKNISFSDSALEKIIASYTREAGVRNLEREIAKVFRKSAKEIVLQKSSSPKNKKKIHSSLEITSEKIEEFLGVPPFRQQRSFRKGQAGIVTGLAWTSVGGDVLFVEVLTMKGKERLMLTGQLGDVMKESAQAGLSYLRSHAALFGLSTDAFKDKEVHIHIPEGAIPKDGPSAGITMVIGLISAFTGKPVPNTVAMTGEITLRGDVLAIGGLNEKLLAAKRFNITTVLIPEENEIDIREVHEKTKSGLTIIPISRVEDAIPHIFPDLIKSGKKK